MEDVMEQPGAQATDSATTESAAASLGLGKSEYLEPDDFNPIEGEGEGNIEPVEEDEELEIGDRKIAMPKSIAEVLKRERMMHADYTQKTQTVAEERRQIAAQREQVERQAQEQQQYIKEIARVEHLSDQLAQLEKFDWNTLIQSDPVQALQLQQHQQALIRQHQEAQKVITKKQSQIALVRQQEYAKQAQDALAYVQREIPGWSEEMGVKVNDYALQQGLSAQHIPAMVLQSPAVIKLMHKAMLYDGIVAKQAAAKQKAEAAPEAKPATRIGSKSPVQKDPSEMTDAEFAAWRRKTSSRK